MSANVGKTKMVRVFSSSYVGLRSEHPGAFAIRPANGGYQGLIEVDVSTKSDTINKQLIEGFNNVHSVRN